jgi:hypothetical protein
LFNVFIEGQQVLANFDIFAEATGANLSVARSFTNTVADGQLEIQFYPIVNNARVSGVEVQKIGDVATDVDGLPDWWRLAYFDHATGQVVDNSRALDDADGDGKTNADEFTAGTDPTNPGSAFRITAITGNNGDLVISWITVQGKSYQLQRADTPDAAATWTDVGTVVTGTGGMVNVPDPGALADARHFYRVKIP